MHVFIEKQLNFFGSTTFLRRMRSIRAFNSWSIFEPVIYAADLINKKKRFEYEELNEEIFQWKL